MATIVVAWFVGKALVEQWHDVTRQPLELHPNWLIIAASALVVLGAYAVLIEAWRRILVAWNTSLAFWPAVRIMSVSRLGLYVPGRIWQMTAMSTMAEREGVKWQAAVGSSVLNTIVNIAMGFLVALVAGWRSFDKISQGRTGLGVTLLAVVLGAVLLLPSALPLILSAARRLTKKDVPDVTLPHRAVYLAIGANIAAWLLYGAAFQLFVRGVTGSAPGSYADYVTAFAWPYLVGYLALVVPGGLGVREGMLAVTLGALNLATPATAVVIAVSSRLWLSLLEVVPGLLFLRRTGGSRSRAQPT
ncbi:MAG TPA: lysylphosphatidylglycerol synthase domain-containing protein [Gemmatimonadaceae bacterium]|nr:lysylphosphatidylglycerol synthase domain-containing protein [Gemmatimonadaceae bacterium]